MAEEVTNLVFGLFSTTSSGGTSLAVTLIFFTVVIAIYALFVYYFYLFLAKKNIIELNLSQYNLYENPAVVKFFAVVFYIIEYIILLPILTFIWFAVLSILTVVLAADIPTSTVLLIAAALVSAVRVTAYVSENLSKDLAKMLPFTLLAVSITERGFFNIGALFSRIAEIPGLLPQIPYYLLFIVAIELVMRIIDIITNAFRGTDGEIGTQSE